MSNSDSPLRGRVAFITGSSGGIGGALAQALAAAGAHLFLSGRDESRLRATAQKAEGEGATVVCFAGDLTQDDRLDEAASHAEKELGGVDLLIHSAGYFHMGPVESAPIEELDRMYRVNLRLPYRLTQRLLPTLKQREGEIVLVNSTSGLAAVRSGAAAYGASKHALRAFADSLRDEVNDDGVRVLSVFPGRTASPMQARVRELEGLPYEPERILQPEDVASSVLHALSLPRTAEMTDLMVRPHRK